MTCVVSTLRMPSSWQKPSSSTLIAGRIGVGQLGQVADAHHHFGIGIAAADFEIAAQAGGEAEADRLEHRIDPQRHAGGGEELDRFVQAAERGKIVGHDDHLAAPVAGGLRDCVALTDSTSSAPARTAGAISAGFRLSIETRCPSLFRARTHSATPDHGSPGSQPTSIRSAPAVSQLAGLGQNLGQRQPRGVVDLGQDLDVVGAVVGDAAIGLAEELVAVAAGRAGRARPACRWPLAIGVRSPWQ